MSCISCNLDISDNAKFCPSCGHDQSIINQCAKCNSDLEAGSSFCGECGNPVGASGIVFDKEKVNEVASSFVEFLHRIFPGTKNPNRVKKLEYFKWLVLGMLAQAIIQTVMYIGLSIPTPRSFSGVIHFISLLTALYVLLRLFLPRYYGRLKDVAFQNVAIFNVIHSAFMVLWLAIPFWQPLYIIIGPLSVITLITLGLLPSRSDSN